MISRVPLGRSVKACHMKRPIIRLVNPLPLQALVTICGDPIVTVRSHVSSGVFRIGDPVRMLAKWAEGVVRSDCVRCGADSKILWMPMHTTRADKDDIRYL